jgi:tetratricopeptide (TPR) repeat protein
MKLAWQLAMSPSAKQLGFLTLLIGSSGSLLAQSKSQQEVLELYRGASESFADQHWDQAIERFGQVAQLRPSSPLAIEAGFFELLATHRKIQFGPVQELSSSGPLDDAFETTRAQFAQACSDWHCLASSWLHSDRITKTASYSEKLNGRIDSVLKIETELAFASKRYQQSLSLLNQSIQQATSEPLEGELVRLECFVQLQRWPDAANSIESLQLRAEEDLAQSPPPDWIERFLLRKAEVAMVLAKWKDAESDVWKIRTHFPECKVSAQVDYVLARCWIHEAKFEDARQLLASILESRRGTHAELQAKAWWTLAESYLMQRNYHEAYACYEQVVKIATDSKWTELAQRQMAMCRQASGSSIADRSDANNASPVRSTQKQMPKQSR